MTRNSAKSQRKDNQSLLTKHFTFPSRLFVQPYNPPKNTQVRWRTQADSLISLNTLFRWHAALLYILYISIFWGEREKVWNSLLVIPPTSLRPPPPPQVFSSCYPLLFLRHKIHLMKDMQGQGAKASSFSFPDRSDTKTCSCNGLLSKKRTFHCTGRSWTEIYYWGAGSPFPKNIWTYIWKHMKTLQNF